MRAVIEDAGWGDAFSHGTGHGVGYFLAVHEGPQSISPAQGEAHHAMQPGMITSIEPGLYKAGEWGIRIENLQVVTEPSAIPGGEREMLGFETLTLAPLDRRLIVVAAADLGTPSTAAPGTIVSIDASGLVVATALELEREAELGTVTVKTDGPAQVNVSQQVVFRLQIVFGEVAVVQSEAGVVHQYVQAAHLFDGRRNQRVNGLGGGDVADDGLDLAQAECGQLIAISRA